MAAGGGVDVVVPFGGDADEAAGLVAALARFELAAADTLTVVDNTPTALLSGIAVEDCAGGRARVLSARGERSSYHARNVGAAGGRGEWLLFTDADCLPGPGLLAAHLAAVAGAPTGDRVGIVAGSVRSLPGQTSRAARYAASRGHIGEGGHVAAPRPTGVTANLLVRRQAYEQVGGFAEGVRSGADLEFCLRTQEQDWALIHASAAFVEHRHPETVAAMLAKARRHGAGRRWVNGCVPGALPRPAMLRPYVRGPAAAGALLLIGRREQAAFKLLDIRHSTAVLRGYWFGDNTAEPWPR